MHTTYTRRSRAFTLIELIVVVLISGILVAVGAFAYTSVLSSVRDNADQARAEQVSAEIKGAAAVKGQSLEQAIQDVPTNVAAGAFSDSLKADLGVTNEALFVTPLRAASPFPARLQTRDGDSYSCMPVAGGKPTSGPCPLLTNPGFEDEAAFSAGYGADAVAGYWSSPVRRDTTERRSGDASARVTLSNSHNQVAGVVILARNGLRVPAATPVRASAWVKAPEGLTLLIAIRAHSAEYGNLDEGGGQTAFTGTGQWQKVETKTWSHPTASSHPGLQITTPHAGGGQDIWVDDVSISIR